MVEMKRKKSRAVEMLKIPSQWKNEVKNEITPAALTIRSIISATTIVCVVSLAIICFFFRGILHIIYTY